MQNAECKMKESERLFDVEPQNGVQPLSAQKISCKIKKIVFGLDKAANIYYNIKSRGLMAQLVERRVRNAEVRGSTPLGSTRNPQSNHI